MLACLKERVGAARESRAYQCVHERMPRFLLLSPGRLGDEPANAVFSSADQHHPKSQAA